MSPQHDASPERDGHGINREDDEAEVSLPDAHARPKLSQSEANALVLMWNSMQGVSSATEKKSWIDWRFIIPVAIGFLSTAAIQLQSYTQLGDRVESFGRRLEIVERIQGDGGKELALQVNASGLQDERLQNLTKALEQERQARHEAEADMRRSSADQRSIVNDLSKIIGEMRTDFKVIVDRLQRHGELDRSERDMHG